MNPRILRAAVAGAVSVSLIVLGAAGYAADKAVKTTRTTTESRNAQTNAAQTTSTIEEQNFIPALHRANRLIGAKVVNPQDEELGRIEDIVIEDGGSRISYAAVSFGGWMGIGDKFFAVPWSALRLEGTEANPKIVLDATRQELKDAPGFDKKHWPDMADRSWGFAVYRFYGQRPYWESDQRMTGRDEERFGRDDTADARRYSEDRWDDGRAPENRETRRWDEFGNEIHMRAYDQPRNPNYPSTHGAQDAARYTDADRRYDNRADGTRYDRSYDARYSQPYGNVDDRDRALNDRDAYTNRDDRGWMQRWREDRREQRDFSSRRLSKVVGTNVKNLDGDSLGSIEDVVVDTHEGRVVFGVVSLGGVWGTGINEKLVAVPWSAVEMRPLLSTARLDADKQALEAAAFDEHHWPDLSNRSYARRMYQQFDRTPYWEVYGYDRNERGNPAAAWRLGSDYTSSFDPASIITIDGVVESVGTFEPAAGAAQGIRLRVKTTDQGTFTVYAGPRSFADKSDIVFYYGDQVKVTGSKTNVDGRGVLMATEVQKGNQTLKLMDGSGKPQWQEQDLYQRPMRDRSRD